MVAQRYCAKILSMAGFQFSAKNSWSSCAGFTLIILVGFALRLYKLGDQSLWYDETVSAFLANQPVTELVAHTARDIHPPGYYLLLHFWATATGHSEFALAYFSLLFGVLLIPLTHLLARRLVNRSTAWWTALLVAVSPYNIWYSQEVRMYTLGAGLGLAAALWALQALRARPDQARRYWLGYLIAATMGLYILYYFAFLLIVLNLYLLIYILRPIIRPTALRALLVANVLLLLTYLPWLPLAWRQVTNPPVPAWRSPPSLWSVTVESWSALILGQSAEPGTFWPVLLLVLVLLVLSLVSSGHEKTIQTTQETGLAGSTCSYFTSYPSFLLTYTFGSLLVIYLLSFITPLYHVRYLFTYSPAFYILVGSSLVWLTRRTRWWLALMVLIILMAASLLSIYQFHFNPRYRSDDYRQAVDFIEHHWQPGDVILVNAGYTYTAFVYYSNLSNLNRNRLVPYRQPTQPDEPLLLQTGTVDGPAQLGWGNPRSDFYAMSSTETLAALDQLSKDFSRLWMLRAYDTVTDPTALIRSWLAEHTIAIEDQPFSGQSNIRVQGFLLAGQSHALRPPIPFDDGLILAGWQLPSQTWQASQTIHPKLWWTTSAPPSVDYKISLKMWTSEGQLAAQGRDEWPAGTLYRTSAWSVGDLVYHPTSLTLPANLAPGQYWLNVELYHPETIQPLYRQDNGESAVTLGPVNVGQ